MGRYETPGRLAVRAAFRDSSVAPVAALTEGIRSNVPIGRGLCWLRRVDGDRFIERYRFGQDLVAGTAAVKPAFTGIVRCCHGPSPFAVVASCGFGRQVLGRSVDPGQVLTPAGSIPSAGNSLNSLH